MNTDNINEQENQNEDNSFLSMYNYFTNNYHELDNLDNYDDITNEKSN